MRTHFKLFPFFVFLLVSMVCRGDNVYQQRLASLQSAIPLNYNDQVKYQIDAILNQSNEENGKMIGLGTLLFPEVEKAFQSYGVPTEFKFLMPALSGMDNNKTNAFGSGGYFQFLYQNAKVYQLKITSFVDERRDPVRSAWAAAKYLKELHAIYNDWLLCIAAFTSTPANVNKAIVMAGGSMNYWSVHPFLPLETRDAVPRFIASVYVFNFYKDHHIVAATNFPSRESDTIEVTQQVSFDQIALILDIQKSTLEWLNPIYKMGIVPFAETHYKVNLPKGKGPLFLQKQNLIYQNEIRKPGNQQPVIIEGPAPTDQTTTPKLVKVYYKVKAGDQMITIADCFDCTVSQLKTWNKLRSNALPVGKMLAFWVNSENLKSYKLVNGMNQKQKQNLAKKD